MAAATGFAAAAAVRAASASFVPGMRSGSLVTTVARAGDDAGAEGCGVTAWTGAAAGGEAVLSAGVAGLSAGIAADGS